MVVAVIASFGYSLLVGVLMGFRVHALGVYWVRITLWFVLPIGTVFGVFLPQSIAALNRKMAMEKGFRWGAASGIVCGVLWATQLSLSIHAVEMLPWWIVLFGGNDGHLFRVFCCVGSTQMREQGVPAIAPEFALTSRHATNGVLDYW
jgi:hypothetical protein